MTYIPEDSEELERIGVELTEEEKLKERKRCIFWLICESPSKSLNWACATGEQTQSCITYHVLKAKYEKEEKVRLKDQGGVTGWQIINA